jgi:hypothetical protein
VRILAIALMTKMVDSFNRRKMRKQFNDLLVFGL